MLYLRPPLARDFLESIEPAGNIVTPSEGEDRHESQDAGIAPHGVGCA
jgi:hypothetical protein